MAEPRIYQAANGKWVVFDGSEKHYFTEEEESKAQQFYRGLQIMSAIVEFQEKIGQLGDLAVQMLNLARVAERIYTVNQIATLVDATEPGEIVGDSNLTKEAVEAYALLLEAFLDWVGDALDNSMTPEDILFLR